MIQQTEPSVGFICSYKKARNVETLRVKLAEVNRLYGQRRCNLEGIGTDKEPGYDGHIAVETAWTLATDCLCREVGQEPDLPLMAGYTAAYMLQSVVPKSNPGLAEIAQLLAVEKSVWKLKRTGVDLVVAAQPNALYVKVSNMLEAGGETIQVHPGEKTAGVSKLQAELCAATTYFAMKPSARSQIESWRRLVGSWVKRLKTINLDTCMVPCDPSDRPVCTPLEQAELSQAAQLAVSLGYIV